MIRFYASVPAARLALFRIAVGAFALSYLTTRFSGFTNMIRLEHWQFAPVGLAQLAGPLPPLAVTGLVVLTTALALAFTVGIAYRITAPSFALSLLWITSYRSSWGMLFHTDNLLVMQTLSLALAPAADALSLDARRHPRPTNEDGRYGWALNSACFIAVIAYFAAGVAKLKLGGLGWLEGEQLRGQIAYDNLRKVELGRSASDLGVWFVRHPALFPPLAALTLVVELGAPLALLHRRIALVWALAALGFHVGVAVLMNIKFPYPLSFVPFLPFFRLERWPETWLGRRMRARWPWLAAAAALCSGCCQPPPLAPKPATLLPDPQGPILVLGDTQRTTCLESVCREQNEAARRQLVDAIAGGARPAFIAHLGDMVAQGDSAAEWRYFDALMSPLQRVPIYPVLGNHDLWGDDRAALAFAVQKFPVLETRFYSRRFRELGLIWLDSNLEGRAGRLQEAWLRATLATMDADASLRAVLLFVHHPPFTRGVGRTPEPYVVEHVLPAFRGSKKTLALFSGHVHGYERFEEAGKHYVVTGGGGGPRVEYRPSRHPGYAPDSSEPRAFNYVALRVLPQGLELSAKCVGLTGGCKNGELEHVPLLPWPRAANQHADQSGS